jgi:uncharacterized protein (DUF1501 family)
MLSRRQFIGLSGGAAIAGAAAWAGLLREHSSGSGAEVGSGGRVLVVVQMSGGNDALNTLIPLNGTYHELRPNLGIADDKLVALRGEPNLGLHPSLQPLAPMYESGQLAIVPGVGFASDSRSHFASQDVWWTASPDHTKVDGWLGRWLDSSGEANSNPLVAISLGGGAVRTLVADHSESTAINDVSSFQLQGATGSNGGDFAQAFAATAAPPSGDALLAQSQSSVTAALRAVDVFAKAGVATTPSGDKPSADSGGEITAGLATAANLIDLDLGTRVVVVSGAGFDTHANQADHHARLLADLAGGISSFFGALQQKGHADRVVLVTTSEFGRRAAENGSAGTDHGLGGVQFVAGPGVHGGVHGTVDLTNLADGDLPVQTDARSLYAAGLDWLGGPSSELLDGYKDQLGLVAA